MDKLLMAFEDDFISFSDEYFEEPSNQAKIAKFKTSKEELVNIQRKYFLSFWFSSLLEIIKEKKRPNDTFPLDVDCAIHAVYNPDNNYLAKIVNLLELLSRKENFNYFEYAFTYDPADLYGASAHCKILSSLAVDNKYLFTWNPVKGDKFILRSDKRFSGLLPFLFYNNYQELYERVFQFCLLVMKTFSYRSGKMVLAILNFLKENDITKYEIFKKEFDSVRKTDKTVWNNPLLYGHYGNGFEVKKEYWDLPFMEALE